MKRLSFTLIVMILFSGISYSNSTRQSRLNAGLSIGTPAGINLLFSLNTAKMEMKISGLYAGNREEGWIANGIQCDVIRNFEQRGSLTHGVGVALGHRDYGRTIPQLNYAALIYEIKWRRFFLQVGLPYTFNTTSKIEPFLVISQLGVLIPLK